jgi:hypothetical protein
MGRSVNYLTEAVGVTYVNATEFGYEDVLECNDCGCELYCYETEYEDGDGCSCCDEGTFELKQKYSDFQAETDWEIFVEDIKESLTAKYHSLWEEDDWEGNEVHIILRNSQVNIGISEYCGLASISVAVRGDLYEGEGLAERNAGFIADYIEKTFGNLKKVGSFSNGECIYEAA